MQIYSEIHENPDKKEKKKVCNKTIIGYSAFNKCKTKIAKDNSTSCA